MENGSFIDYYDFLMISPSADRQMIEWAARLMLARYDPQKSKTPDEKKCELVKEAFRTLADPKRRAAYDTELNKNKPSATTSVDLNASITAEDVSNAHLMRRAIMLVLYQAMMRQPRDPDIGRTDLARQVGVTAQELEFALWFLREKDWITATQAGSYAITVGGAEWVESGGIPALTVGPGAGAEFEHELGALGRGVSSQSAPNGRPAALPPSTSVETAPTPQLRLQQQKVV